MYVKLPLKDLNLNPYPLTQQDLYLWSNHHTKSLRWYPKVQTHAHIKTSLTHENMINQNSKHNLTRQEGSSLKFLKH